MVPSDGHSKLARLDSSSTSVIDPVVTRTGVSREALQRPARNAMEMPVNRDSKEPVGSRHYWERIKHGLS